MHFQDKLKKEEIEKAKNQTSHAINDFKDQCAKVRSELEQAYKMKVNKKVDKFKQEHAILRETEIRQEYAKEIDQLKKLNESLAIECNKAKKELRRSMNR